MQRVSNRIWNFIGGGNYEEMIDINRQKFIDLFVKNIHKTITLILVLYSIYFYFRYIRNRVRRLLLVSFDRYAPERYIKRISQSENCNLKLCDMYIASSAKSYLPGSQYYDYANVLAIEHALKLGARLIELDVFCESYCPSAIPVVANGKEIGNWHYTTRETLDACFSTISSIAFNRAVLANYDDPLFIYLNLNLGGNSECAEKVAGLIYKYFGENLYKNNEDIIDPIEQNIYKKKLLAFINKVVIITNTVQYHYASIRGSNYKLRDMVSLTPYDKVSKTGDVFVSEFTSDKVDDIYDVKSITDDNKLSLGFVFPGFTERLTKNIHPGLPLTMGFQFVAMNYQVVDESMDFYMNKIFKTSSFVDKPPKLRYIELDQTVDKNVNTPDAKATQNMVSGMTGTGSVN